MPKEKDGMGQRIGQNSCGKDDASRGASFVSKKNKSPPPFEREGKNETRGRHDCRHNIYWNIFVVLVHQRRDPRRPAGHFRWTKGAVQLYKKKKKNIHYEYMKKIIKYMYFRKRLMFTEWFPKKKKCFGL